MQRRGTGLVGFSAAGFGVMAVLAKDAGTARAGVGTVLAARFLLAGALFWLLAAARGLRPGRLMQRT